MTSNHVYAFSISAKEPNQTVICVARDFSCLIFYGKFLFELGATAEMFLELRNKLLTLFHRWTTVALVTIHHISIS